MSNDLRKQFINCMTIQRDRKVLPNPDADSVILVNDLVVVLSTQSNLTDHCNLFLNPK